MVCAFFLQIKSLKHKLFKTGIGIASAYSAQLRHLRKEYFQAQLGLAVLSMTYSPSPSKSNCVDVRVFLPFPVP